MITLRVGNIDTRLVGFIPQSIIEEISMEMSYKIPGAAFAMAAVGNGRWDGRIRLFRRRGNRFPTGLISICRDGLRRNGIGYRVVDERPNVNLTNPIRVFKLKLFPDQADVIEKCLQKQRGVVRAATGWGKTEVFISLIARLNVPTAVIIHRETIFSQIYHRMQTRLKRRDLIGRIGSGYSDPKRITVCMMQTLVQPRWEAYRKSVRCVVVDECHHTPADTIYDTMKLMTNAQYRFGFSATPWRDDNADLYIQAAFADKIVDISASALIVQNRLAKPTIYFVPIKRIDLPSLGYPSIYSKAIVHGTDRNETVVRVVRHLVGLRKTVLVSVTRIEHGKILEKMIFEADPKIRITFIKGEDTSEKKQRTLKILHQRKLDVVIATTVYGEGVDVPSLDALVNAKAQKSSVDAYQLVGRTLRNISGKKNRAIVVDFADEQKFLKAHAKSRRRIYATEQEFDIRNLSSVDQIESIA